MSDWIDHRTAGRPVPLGQWVEIANADGETLKGLADNIDWGPIDAEGRVVRYRLIPPIVAVGDLDSNSLGSGARFNAGKAPLELIPASVFADYRAWSDGQAPHLPGPIRWVRALEALNAFQMHREGAHSLLCLLYHLDAEPGMWAECAAVFDYGRKKYAAWNWAKGMQWSVPIGCILRHIVLGILQGEPTDPESGLPHRGHVVCNIVMLLWFIDNFPEGDDRRELPEAVGA